MTEELAHIRWLSPERFSKCCSYCAPARFVANPDPYDLWDLQVEKVEEQEGGRVWIAVVWFGRSYAPHQYLMPGAEFELLEGNRFAAGRVL